MRKTILFFLTFIIFNHSAISQKTAITDNGDEVILYDNGTWKYSKDFKNEETPIPMNPIKFTRDKESSFLLKSNKIHLGFWLDPKKWRFNKATSNEDAEYELQLKEQSMQVVIISEKIQLSLVALRGIVITNAVAVSPDYHILHEEYRMVNGLKVLYMQAEATVSGMKAFYYSYYYTDSTSALQFVAIGFIKANNEDKKNAEDLLNGLVIIPQSKDESGKEADAPKIVSEENDYKNTSKVSQGSLSPNNNCRKYFPGKWSYMVRDTNVIIERSLNKTIEHYGRYSYEYDNKWISNCEYQLIFRKTSAPDYTREKIGEVMLVNIMEIDNKMMRYKVNFRGMDLNGEMEKVISSN